MLGPRQTSCSCSLPDAEESYRLAHVDTHFSNQCNESFFLFCSFPAFLYLYHIICFHTLINTVF